MRWAATDAKGTDRMDASWYEGPFITLAPGTDFEDIAYTAPELAVADADAPGDSAHDTTIKCVYTDTTFYALITSATDSEHGLVGEDGYNLVDHDGSPFDALPEGAYTIEATLSDADGQILGSDTKNIEIGESGGTVIHEITTQTAIEKGGMDLMLAWAEEQNAKVLNDLRPGMFGPFYQMTTIQMSVGAETAEYIPGRIPMLVYNNMTTSTSYCLEVAQYLQLAHNAENPDVAAYFCFDLGEPSFGGREASIVPFGEGENMRLCRIDAVSDDAQDGVFLTTEEQLLGYDADGTDGWSADAGKPFAIMGVMRPYQLKDDELVPNDEVFGYYDYLNGAQTLKYTFTPIGGSDGEALSFEKPVGVSRIDTPDDQSDPAAYEFYNVFAAGTLQAGTDYDVAVQAFDRTGSPIEGMAATFRIDMA